MMGQWARNSGLSNVDRPDTYRRRKLGLLDARLGSIQVKAATELRAVANPNRPGTQLIWREMGTGEVPEMFPRESGGRAIRNGLAASEFDKQLGGREIKKEGTLIAR